MKLHLDLSEPWHATAFQKAIFTEGRKATGVGSHKISKQTQFLPLIAKSQGHFALFCSKQWIEAFCLGDSSHP
jgi:hypothetical protein